jgi:hypothetical protein
MRLGVYIQTRQKLTQNDVPTIKSVLKRIHGDNQCILVVHWLSPFRHILEYLGYEYVLVISFVSAKLEKNANIINNAKYVLLYDSKEDFQANTLKHIANLSDAVVINKKQIGLDYYKVYNVALYIN